ncbi:MAG: cytochrome c [Sphingomonas sp.]|uniref:c-type cytochrome n=1 Tax=Sphingomonas sp. TaxID=28214 RepID=UPI0022731578|nr:cytochrome c [Sphingomonas sp.]MCX8475946.1 cytochrome c [Sphingomonas sp.]
MVRALGSIVAVAALTLVAACSGGSAENPREAKFKAIAKANKAIGEELKKDAPSVELVAANAKTLDGLARELPGWFPGATGPEPGIETEAKPDIWQKPTEFKAAAAKFAAATGVLQAAAATGDVAQVKAAAAGVGPACKGCHDSFRLKK